MLFPGDSIRKDDPSVTGQLDAQRFEFIPGNGQQMDSKSLEVLSFVPIKQLSLLPVNDGSGLAYSNAAWVELNAHPDTYWSQVPWGAHYAMYWTGSAWFIDSGLIVGGLFPWVLSVSYWTMDGTAAPAVLINASDIAGSIVTQMFCPKLFDAQNYELWTVTGRWDTELNSTGTFPSPNPWSSSSDFALQLSGSFGPGTSLVIPPPFFDPLGTMQVPPAPASYASPNYDTVWTGWAQGQYLVLL